MNDYQKQVEEGKAVIRKKNITFACFKMVVLALMHGFKHKWTEDDWVCHYEIYARGCAVKFEEIEDWADFFFEEWRIDVHGSELRKQPWKKFDPAYPPPFQKGFIILIPREDNHITTGMWDVSGEWVVLDQYRTLKKNQTIYYRPLPDLPDVIK